MKNLKIIISGKSWIILFVGNDLIHIDSCEMEIIKRDQTVHDDLSG